MSKSNPLDHTPLSVRLVASRYDNFFKQLITAGWNVSSDGDVESPWGFFALVEIPEHSGELAEMVAAVWLEASDEEFRQMAAELPAGWYTTCENSDGIISVYEMTNELIAKHVYSEREKAYADWVSRTDEKDEDEGVRGCSCGMADYGAPGHDGYDEDKS